MSGVAIGELAPGDPRRPALARLAARIWHEHYDPLVGSEQVEHMLVRFQSESALESQLAEGMRYLLLESEGEIVGYAGIRAESDHLFLSKFYLVSELRGLGLGRLLFEKALEVARSAGLPAVRLTVNRGNDLALSVYASLGFAHLRDQVADIGEGFVMDDHVLELRLDSPRSEGD